MEVGTSIPKMICTGKFLRTTRNIVKYVKKYALFNVWFGSISHVQSQLHHALKHSFMG